MSASAAVARRPVPPLAHARELVEGVLPPVVALIIAIGLWEGAGSR